MNKFFNTIISKISWKKAILFTMLFFAFFILINYSGVGVKGLLDISSGSNILDFEFGFNYGKAHKILAALGDEGRTFYLTKIMPLDFPFPFTYMLFYLGWIALLLKHLRPRKQYKYLLFMPILAMLFDWVENIGIITMLLYYPNIPSWAVLLASIFGMLKTIFTIGSIAIIGILFILLIYSSKQIRRCQ